jgi:hypothetical protein
MKVKMLIAAVLFSALSFGFSANASAQQRGQHNTRYEQKDNNQKYGNRSQRGDNDRRYGNSQSSHRHERMERRRSHRHHRMSYNGRHNMHHHHHRGNRMYGRN